MPDLIRPRLPLLLVLLALCGCASNGPEPSSRSATTAGDWRSALAQAAERQEDRPDRRAQAAPAPAGLDLTELEEEEPLLATREEAIEHYAQPAPEDTPAPVEAVRRYVSGRAALARGNSELAVRELERAAAADPSSPDVLTALGEARLGSGDRLAALSAFRDAFAAGGRAPGMLLLLGLQSQREDDQAAAAQYLATLLKLPRTGDDPAVQPLANVALGESLLALGHPRAGRAALSAGLDLPDAWSTWTRFSTEMAALYRSRPLLWRLVGDTSLQLGEYEAALDAYAKAGDILPAQAWALSERRVYAAMRAGNPAAAARIVLEEVAADPRLVRDRHVRLMRHVCTAWPEGAKFAASAAATARARLAEQMTPKLESRLVRLQAAAADDEAAVALLTAHLERFPLDEAAIADLAARLPGQAKAILRSTGAVAARQPGAASLLAAAVLERFGAPGADLRPRDVGERIMLSAWLREAGEIDAAQRVAGPLAIETESPAALEQSGLAAAAAADWAGAEGALASLAGADLARTCARASLLEALQRFDEALAEMRTLDATSAPPRRLLDVARAAAQAGEAEAMRDVLTNALDRDPYLEQTYAALIEAYRAMGDTSSDQRRQVGARLQTLSPDGTTLLMLRARELMQAGQHEHAFSQIRELARRSPRDPDVRNLALEISERLVAAEPDRLDAALGWLATAHHWDPSWAVAVEARLRLAAGRADEAEQILRDAITAEGAEGKRSPSPRLAAALERVLRASDRAAEADEVAMARLAEAPPTFENVAEHTGLLAQRGDSAHAIELLESLPDGSRFLDRQALVLLAGVQQAVQQAMRGGMPQEMRQTLDLIRAAKRHAAATPPIHLLHLQLAVALADSWATSEAIQGLAQAGLMRQLADLYGMPHEGLTDEQLAAEVCYQFGLLFAGRDRPAEAEAMYRLALTYDSRHAWSCNNLGYELVERGENIEEAERLLLIAYDELGSEASVIDSLAWLRYRQGSLADTIDADSGQPIPGAVSLLQEAVAGRTGAQNPTLLDHYGDALWRAGRPLDASKQWNMAIEAAAELLRDPSRRNMSGTYVDGLTARMRQLRQKVMAASSGQAPAVAPLFPGVSLESHAATGNNPGAAQQE